MKPDPSLYEIIRSAWTGRNYVVSGLALGCIAASLLTVSLMPRYEARMIIAPSLSGGEERSLTVLNENPSLSRTTSVSSELPREYIKFQQTFRETGAARILSKYQGMLDQINKDRLFRFGSGPGIETPSELSDYLQSHVTIDNIGATSSQILVYLHPDPVFAERFLRHLHKVTDEMIRNEARVQTEARIAYLQKALRAAYNPDHRKALTDQLMMEERQKMAISMDGPYAAEVLEDASVSSKPVWPKAFIIFSLLGAIGAFTGFFIYSVKRVPS